MNILLFVMTMLFLFAALTYARIEGYKSFSGMRTQFVQFMQVSERDGYDKGSNIWYEKHRMSTNAQGSQGGQGQPPANASQPVATASSSTGFARLNIAPLLKKPDQQNGTANEPSQQPLSSSSANSSPGGGTSDSDQYNQTYMILKKLIYYLYANKQFFQELEKTRPGFVDEIIQKMREIVANLPDNKIKYAKDLGNFNFNDEQLNYVTYKMFNGVSVPTSAPLNSASSQSMLQQDQPILEDDSETVAPPDANEYHSEPGYASLLDFLMFNKKNTKIKVALAGKPLLMAIFDDPNTVNEIIQMRKNIRRELIGKRVSSAQASESFKNAFLNRRNPSISENILDFNIATTKPYDQWD